MYLGLQEAVQRLKDNDLSLTMLNLGYNSIGDDNAKDIAGVLEKNTTLTKLDLSNNSIGPTKGAKDIAGALQKNTTLTVLNLGSNSIGDDSAKDIAGALKKNTTLTKLDLSNKSIGPKGAKDIAGALEKNTTLTKLDLYNNSISTSVQILVIEIVKANEKQRQDLEEQEEADQRRQQKQQEMDGFFNALNSIKTLASVEDGDLEKAMGFMSDFLQLKYVFTTVNTYYRLQLLTEEDLRKLLKAALTKAKDWCTKPIFVAMYDVALEYAVEQNIIVEFEKKIFLVQANETNILNNDTIKAMQDMLESHAQHLDNLEVMLFKRLNTLIVISS